MDIRPYRSQVRETPTQEPVSSRIPNVGARYQAWGDMITKTGQNISSAMYQFNDARERRQANDDDMALRAICQDIDQAFLDFSNETASFFEKDANDPTKIFYGDKSSYDQFYQNGINSIQINTLDKIKNPRIAEAARIYFNEKRMRAGQGFLDTYNENKKTAEGLVFGRELDEKVQKAIGARWDEDLNLYKDDIAKTVDDMAGRGMIRQDQIEDVIKDADKKIQYGRAVNTLDVLINTDRYEDAQKFMDTIPEKSMDEGAKKALQDHFKDRMMVKKNIIEHQQGKIYNEGVDLYGKKQLTREWINGHRDVLRVIPELDINTDYSKFLFSLLDADDKVAETKAKAEKSDASYRNYFNQIDNIQKSDKTPEEKQAELGTLWEKIKNDPDLDQKSDVERLAGFMGVKPGTKSGSGSDDLGYETDLAEFTDFILTNRAATKEVRTELFAEWFPGFLAKHPEAGSKLSMFSTMLDKADELITLPEIKSLQDEVNTKINKYHQDGDREREAALRSASKSFFKVIAEDMWWRYKDGKREETDEPYRKKIFEEAKGQMKTLLDKNSVLDALAGLNLSSNSPVFNETPDGYAMTVDGQYDDMKSIISSAKNLKYTDPGIGFFGQLEGIEKQAIENAIGINMTPFRQILDPETNQLYYYWKGSGEGKGHIQGRGEQTHTADT